MAKNYYNKLTRRWRIVVGLALTFIAVIFLVQHRLFPRDFLPEPTGPYPIGTTVWTVVDESRPEIFTDPGYSRTLTIQAWYPTVFDVEGKIEPYIRDGQIFKSLLKTFGAPGCLLNYLSKATTHGITDAPPAPGSFPVILFASGNLGYRSSNLIQVEELVSHGFIVITFDQPGTFATSLLEDGRRIPYAGFELVGPLVDASLNEPPSQVPTLNGKVYSDGIGAYLGADPCSVLDNLHFGNLPLELKTHMDLERIGAFGISLGGVTMSQWCVTDNRVDACLFLDAPMTRIAGEIGLNIPAAWLTRPASDMVAEDWPDVEVRRYAKSQRDLYENTRAPAWYIEVAGRKHADFTDVPFGSPLWALFGVTSPGDGSVTHEIMRSVTRDFFLTTLVGKDPGVLSENPWPEVMIEHHK